MSAPAVAAPGFGEARAGFLSWLAGERRASPLTVATYAEALDALAAFLAPHQGGEPDLAALRLADLRAFLAHRAGDGPGGGAGAATRAKQLSAIKTFLRHLAKRHGLPPLALAGLSGPRRRPPVPRALSERHARAAASDADAAEDDPRLAARNRALFTLLYGCGLRIAEALSLTCATRRAPGPACGWSARGGRSASSPSSPPSRPRWRTGSGSAGPAAPTTRSSSARRASG